MRKPAVAAVVHSYMSQIVKILGRGIALTAWMAASMPVAADEFALPSAGSDVIGEVLSVQVAGKETLLDLARRHGLGYEEITNANPGVDAWLPGVGTEVVIPKRRLLPMAPRTGIVINLPEHRLYWFPPAAAGKAPVAGTFSIGIGKMD
jgi:L,D-transpeptidase ErfK/SrfK